MDSVRTLYGQSWWLKPLSYPLLSFFQVYPGTNIIAIKYRLLQEFLYSLHRMCPPSNQFQHLAVDALPSQHRPAPSLLPLGLCLEHPPARTCTIVRGLCAPPSALPQFPMKILWKSTHLQARRNRYGWYSYGCTTFCDNHTRSYLLQPTTWTVPCILSALLASSGFPIKRTPLACWLHPHLVRYGHCPKHSWCRYNVTGTCAKTSLQEQSEFWKW